MSNYEKAKLANGSLYEIVPGGLRENSDKTKLTIIALLGERTLSDVDAETDNQDNVKTITVLDSAGDEYEVKKGYVYQTGCKKQKNYTYDRLQINTGEVDGTGNPIMEYQNVTANVVIIELSTADVRKKTEELEKRVRDLNETVDMLVVANLEV